jgi:hypothetical protein
MIEANIGKGKWKTVLAAFFILALSSQIFAYCMEGTATQTCKFGYIPYTSPTGTCCYQDIFLNIASVVLLITFAMVGIAFMLGKALDNAKLNNWAEVEFTQVIGTAIVLMLFVSSTYLLDNLVGPAFYKSSVLFPADTYRTASQTQTEGEYVGWKSVQDHSLNYLGQVRLGIEDFIKGFASMSVYVSAVSNIGVFIQPDPNIAVYYSPFSATFGPIQNTLSMLFMAIVVASSQLQIQIELLSLGTGIFTILLPIGIAFRAFPFTRSAGGAFIALAFGFTIMLPIAYLVVEDISLHMYGTEGRPSGSQLTSQIQSISFSVSSPDEMKTFLDKGFAPPDPADPQKGSLRRLAMFLAIEVTLLPMMAYLMVLNITKEIAELFGSHIDFSTLVRFI